MSIKSVLLVVVVGLIVVFGGWYISSLLINRPGSSQQSLGSASDSLDSIAKDLNQVPDDSSGSNDINSLDKNLQGF